MGLSFLGPWFLAGLAALSVPVLVHLVRRSDAVARRFPSVMFLSRIDHPVRQRRRIEHWGLLLLRCLALALVVLAFAQPTFEAASLDKIMGERNRDVVVLVDQSYSMGYADHWQRARAAAHQAVNELGPGDRAALAFFDDRAHVATELTTDRDRLHRTIDGKIPSARATALDAGLRHAIELLSGEASSSAREIRIISDFQRTGWDPAGEIELPPDVDVSMIDITTPNAENAAVTVAGPLSTSGASGASGATDDRRKRVGVDVNIVNPGAHPVPDRTIVLEVDGRELESRVAKLSGHAVHTERFELARPTQGQVKATVRIGPDDLPADDHFRFLLASGNRHAVLVLGSSARIDPTNLYLTGALDVGNAPGFDVVVLPASPLERADLDRVSAVVLDDARLPDGDDGERLRQFVERGGGLLVITGDRLTGQWPGGSDGFLPGRLGSVVKVPGRRGVGLDWLADDHPALTLFASPRSGDFSNLHVMRYRRLRTEPEETVLARYEDGAVALAERVVGRGRVLVLTTALDPGWNNLALQPVFVPLVHELMKYLVAFEPRPEWYTVGEVIDAAAVLGARDQAVAVETPSGKQLELPRQQPVLRLDEPGWFELHTLGGPARSSLVAVNVDPIESDLTPLDVNALAANLRAQQAERAAARGGIAETDRAEDRDERETQRLWWYLLLAAVALLVAESLWSNRISTAPARSKWQGAPDQAGNAI